MRSCLLFVDSEDVLGSLYFVESSMLFAWCLCVCILNADIPFLYSLIIISINCCFSVDFDWIVCFLDWCGVRLYRAGRKHRDCVESQNFKMAIITPTNWTLLPFTMCESVWAWRWPCTADLLCWSCLVYNMALIYGHRWKTETQAHSYFICSCITSSSAGVHFDFHILLIILSASVLLL